MRKTKIVKVSVASLYPNTVRGIGAQAEANGYVITPCDIREYVNGDGRVSEWAPDTVDTAINPLRPRGWHLGRVKYFFERFRQGLPVDPIALGYHYSLGDYVSDGSHRLLGAYFAGIAEIDALM